MHNASCFSLLQNNIARDARGIYAAPEKSKKKPSYLIPNPEPQDVHLILCAREPKSQLLRSLRPLQNEIVLSSSLLIMMRNDAMLRIVNLK